MEKDITGLFEVRASVKWEIIDKILLSCFNGNEMHLFFNNQAGYTTIPVVDGWARAEMRVSHFLTHAHRRTDGRTDGRTKALIELRVRY